MRTIFAGCRYVSDYDFVARSIDAADWDITELIEGGARGVDTLAKQWALAHEVPVKTFPADWRTHGRAAGPIRNRQMAEYAEALIALWDGQSRGTANMIDEANACKLSINVVGIPGAAVDPHTL